MQGGQHAGVVLVVLLVRPAPHAPDPEMELRVAHDAGVGVGEGEVADVGPVLLRQLVLAIVGDGVDVIDDLPQLLVKSYHHDPVKPRTEIVEVVLRLVFRQFGRFYSVYNIKICSQP